MPKRTDIHTVLIIGAGPIVIGQACEFDYSGAQACKALQGRGLSRGAGQFQPGHDHDRSGTGGRHLYRADHAGIRGKDHRARKAERAGRAECSRCCPPWADRPRSTPRCRLRKRGVLEKYDVELIGASARAIDKAEDRELFRAGDDEDRPGCAARA